MESAQAVVTTLDQSQDVNHGWAIVVGVNTYADRLHYGDLRVCSNDARDVSRGLVEGGFKPDRVRLITDETVDRPLLNTILDALTTVRNAAGPDDIIVFYYSGHGDFDASTEASYLVCQDGRIDNLRDTALAIDRVRRDMKDSGARRAVLVLDACHSGARLGKGSQTMSREFLERVFERAEGLAVLSSCRQGELSYEWDEQGRSTFTHFFLEALQGAADSDGKRFVTVQDANRYVADGVGRWAAAKRVAQTPTLEASLTGDIILTRYRMGTPGVTPVPRARTANPFGDLGTITEGFRFFGRGRLLERIMEELGRGVNVSIVGPRQIGKSSILYRVRDDGPDTLSRPIDDFAYLNLALVENMNDFFQALADAVGLPKPARGLALAQALSKEHRQVVLCLDEIEKMALDSFPIDLRMQLRGLADGHNSPLKLVIASRAPLSTVFPDSPKDLSPLSNICRTIRVEPWSPDEVKAFIEQRLSGLPVSFSRDELSKILAETGGRPAEVQEAAAELFIRRMLQA